MDVTIDSNGVPSTSHSSLATLCVVIPVHNRIELARPVFASLAREVAEDGFSSVIVVNQQSSDGVDDLARSYGFHVINSAAATAGGLRNAGVAASTADWFCFVDSDVLLPIGYLQRLRTLVSEYPHAAIGCNYGLPQQTSWSERVWHSLTYQAGDGDRAWLNAGNLAMPRVIFMQLGGFNERLSSGEDTDLCSRARQAGYKILQFEDLTAAHLGNPKTLRAFFAKQLWHGQGSALSNRNSLSAVAHVMLLCGGLFWLKSAPSISSMLLGFTGALSIVPLTAWLALAASGRRASLAQSIVLLNVYLLARATALVYKSNRQR